MLGKLHCHTPRDEPAPISTLSHKLVIYQYIHHEYLEGFGRRDGTEVGILGCITGTETGDTRYDDMEGLCGGRRGVDERVYDLAGFEEGTGPALNEEEGNGVGGGGWVVNEVEDLLTVVGNMYFDFELFKVLVDLCL